MDGLYSLREAKINCHVKVEETLSPKKLAPYTAAVALHCNPEKNNQGGSGRFIVLYDPSQADIWGGDFRLVIMLHADMDPDLTSEELIDQVAWSWLFDCLQGSGAGYSCVAGTVTKTQSSSFGELKRAERECKLEIRASWTPNTNDLSAHLSAVASLLCLLSGKPVDFDNLLDLPA